MPRMKAYEAKKAEKFRLIALYRAKFYDMDHINGKNPLIFLIITRLFKCSGGHDGRPHILRLYENGHSENVLEYNQKVMTAFCRHTDLPIGCFFMKQNFWFFFALKLQPKQP